MGINTNVCKTVKEALDKVYRENVDIGKDLPLAKKFTFAMVHVQLCASCREYAKQCVLEERKRNMQQSKP